MNHALLAFDGSPKAKEALYLSTYWVSRWNISLSVVSVMEASRVTDKTLREAQSYAERHEVKPALVCKSGDVAKAILQTADERKCDFFVMGDTATVPSSKPRSEAKSTRSCESLTNRY